MKRFTVSLVSLSLALGQIIPMTIGQYISRTDNFCQKFDDGRVWAVYQQREEGKLDLSKSQKNTRSRRQMRGAYFTRSAAYSGNVRGCTRPIPTEFHFSRTRGA